MVSCLSQKAKLLHLLYLCTRSVLFLCFVTTNINPHDDNTTINEGKAAQTILILGKSTITRVVNNILLRGVFEDMRLRALQHEKPLNEMKTM